VLPTEILIEAAKGLARMLDHLLDRELLAGAGIKEFDRGIEESLDPNLGPHAS
jgi:hypothetical protein